MIYVARTIILLLSLLSAQVMAEAPVVDDSENFALLEEQPQAAEELPVAHESYNIRADEADSTSPHANTDNTSQNMELINKIQGLQQDIQDLRGQLEVQAHELSELKQQQLSFYQDIDARLSHTSTQKNDPIQSPNTPNSNDILSQTTPEPLPTAPNTTHATDNITIPATTSPSIATTTRPNPADEQIGYLAAYELIKQKQFAPATTAMQQFLAKYPRGGYSANAHYWLGELYLTNKDYTNAITQFDTVLHEFKSSSKYAPSRLKLGYALADSGRIGEAKEQLIAVMSLYPDTSAAHLAHLKLEKLGG